MVNGKPVFHDVNSEIYSGNMVTLSYSWWYKTAKDPKFSWWPPVLCCKDFSLTQLENPVWGSMLPTDDFVHHVCSLCRESEGLQLKLRIWSYVLCCHVARRSRKKRCLICLGVTVGIGIVAAIGALIYFLCKSVSTSHQSRNTSSRLLPLKACIYVS